MVFSVTYIICDAKLDAYRGLKVPYLVIANIDFIRQHEVTFWSELYLHHDIKRSEFGHLR